MSGFRDDASDYARAVDPTLRRLRGALRRMAVDTTARTLWKLLGYLLLDGEREPLSAEVFSGIGFYARPPTGSKAEAIVALAGAPVVVATRDEQTRQAVAGGIGPDETAVFNSAAIVHVKSNGTIEARSKNGVAVPLATKADLDALKEAIIAWSPVPADGGASLKVKLLELFLGPPLWPAGTSKLKGE